MAGAIPRQPTRAELELHPNGAEANSAAIRAVSRCINNYPGMDNDLRTFINSHLSGVFGNLYTRNLPPRGPVVQINADFTKTYPHKEAYIVNVTMDVDIPLQTSNQMPHIGWDAQMNNQNVQRSQDVTGPNRAARLLRQDDSGHCYVAEGVLKTGRPPTGEMSKLVATAGEGGEDATGAMKFRSRFYKIPDDTNM